MVERLILYDIPRIVNVTHIRRWNRPMPIMELNLKDYNFPIPIENNNQNEIHSDEIEESKSKSKSSKKKSKSKKSKLKLWEYEDVIRHRTRKIGNNIVLEFLIKWSGGYKPTWEEKKHLLPEFLDIYINEIESGIRDSRGRRIKPIVNEQLTDS